MAILIMLTLILGVLPNVAAPWRQETGAHTSEISVFSFNALKAGADSKQLAQSIKMTNPDVLVLVETSEPLHQRLAAEGALDALDYRSAPVPTGGEADTVIFSRYPLSQRADALGPEMTEWYGLPVVEVQAPDGPIRVVGVHLYPPLDDAQRWRSGLSALQQWADQHNDMPMILAGDYNSTRTHPQFRQLASSMEPETSWFPVPTWPTGGTLPPVVGIDHVLTRGLAPLGQHTVKIDGSDHLALTVKLGVPNK